MSNAANLTENGVTYYAGIGINAYDFVSLKTHFENWGLSASFEIGGLEVIVDANATGLSTLSLVKNKKTSYNTIRSDGFTIGINSMAAAWIIWMFFYGTSPQGVPVLN